MTPLLVDVIHLQTWIPSIVQLFEERIRNQQQQLYILMTADLPPVTIDAPTLEQTLVNLLTNACAYTPAGELITVSAYATDQAMQISVSSSGIELASWQQNTVELAAVQRLTRRLKASVSLESAANQVTFTLRIPHSVRTGENPRTSKEERIILTAGALTR